jgi:hypothetical protein
MPSNELLQRAKDGAFVAHFAKLFEVLMAQPADPSAWDRFIGGVNRLCHVYDEVEKEEGPQWGL